MLHIFYISLIILIPSLAAAETVPRVVIKHEKSRDEMSGAIKHFYYGSRDKLSVFLYPTYNNRGRGGGVKKVGVYVKSEYPLINCNSSTSGAYRSNTGEVIEVNVVEKNEFCIFDIPKNEFEVKEKIIRIRIPMYRVRDIVIDVDFSRIAGELLSPENKYFKYQIF